MRRLFLFTLVLAFDLFAPAAETVPSAIVGTVSAQGEIKFEPVDEFRIAQSTKIRLLPEPKGTVDPNAIKRLSKTELSQAGVLRNDGKGRLIKLSADGTSREVVLPEDFALKVAAKAEDVPGPLMLTLLRSKKNKQVDTLAPELFYSFLTGAPPDHAVYEFVSNSKAFSTLDEQLKAMEGFVKSFPGTPSVAEFRSQLERQMATELNDLENGGPFGELLRTQRFGELARKVYPADAALQKLYDRIVERRAFIESRVALMPSLALAGDWDLVLENYKDFERYQPSFPTLVSLRQQAYQESARAHSRRARDFSQREDHEDGAREAGLAQVRDPENNVIVTLLDEQKRNAGLAAARKAEKDRKVLTPGSTQEITFNRAIRTASNAIRDKDYVQADAQIQEAARVNSEAPEVYLMSAQLLKSRDRLAESLVKLDAYDRMVTNPTDRAGSETLRTDVLYELKKKKDANHKDLETLWKAKEYSKLDQLMRTALISDPNDLEYLFYGGIAAAILRSGDDAKAHLKSYMDNSDSLAGDRAFRDRAGRVLSGLNADKPAASTDGTTNWMSGRKLPDGVYYCPESLAFQIPIDSVVGNKIKWAFEWDKGRLQSIQTTFESTDGNKLFRSMAGPGALDADAPGATDDPGNFFFRYLEGGQLLGVRTRAPKAAGPGGAAASKAPEFRVAVLSRPKGPLFLADDEGQPEMAFPSHPKVDVGVLNVLGDSVGTTISGSAVFNPFLWDGVHYFSVQYDALGRADVAQEWNADNRVTFLWDGQRLKEIRAYHKDLPTPYYRRSIAYKGSQIDSEEIFVNSKSTGSIKYVYAQGGKGLQQIKVDDGKEWTVKPR